MSLREISDDSGCVWRVWSVIPAGAASPDGERRVRVRPAFQKGWLTFECFDRNERRRVTPIPDGWEQMDERELMRLCGTAEPSTPKKRLVE